MLKDQRISLLLFYSSNAQKKRLVRGIGISQAEIGLDVYKRQTFTFVIIAEVPASDQCFNEF